MTEPHPHHTPSLASYLPKWGSGSNILIQTLPLFLFLSGKRTTYQRESSSHDDKRKSKTSFGWLRSKANEHWANSHQLGLLLSSEEKWADVLLSESKGCFMCNIHQSRSPLCDRYILRFGVTCKSMFELQQTTWCNLETQLIGFVFSCSIQWRLQWSWHKTSNRLSRIS